MKSSAWAITGFKVETFDKSVTTRVLQDRLIGKLEGTWHTIMHGESWVDEDQSIGYAHLNVSLQEMEDFDKLPLDERGLGAVSGGYIMSTNSTSSEPFKIEQKWGVIDTSTAIFLRGFYRNGKKYSRVMVCFDRTKVAPVSGFWRNGKVMVGPNIQCDKTDWGRDLESGSYAIVLTKVENTVVLGVKFTEPASEDGATKTVEPQLLLSEVFTNHSSATAKDNFNLRTTLLDTHTFEFEEGLGVDWSAGWKAKMPLLSDAGTAVEVGVRFRPHQNCAVSATKNVDRSAEIQLTPMTAVKATAQYMKSLLTVNAVLTVQKTYTNGAVQTSKVSAKYTGVSCNLAEVKLEDIPVVPTTIQ